MTIKSAASVLALSQALMFAETGQTQSVTKVIHVRYARAEAVKGLIGGGLDAYANNGLRAIVLKGSAASVAAAEEAVKELDVPAASEMGRNVELTVYVICAGSTAAQSSVSVWQLSTAGQHLAALTGRPVGRRRWTPEELSQCPGGISQPLQHHV